MIFAGVEAERNTKDVTWIQIMQNAPVSLIRGAEPRLEAGNATRAGSIEQKEQARVNPGLLFLFFLVDTRWPPLSRPYFESFFV